MPHRRTWAAITSVMILLLVGCQPAEREQCWGKNQANLQKTFDLIRQSQAEQPAKLQNTLDVIASSHELTVAQFHQIPSRIQHAMNESWTHWRRQQPIYRQHLNEELAGEPISANRLCELFR